jgi:PAS domain S-box-containing protein
MSDSTAIRVLLVEDNSGDARLVEILLSEVDSPRFSITHVERLEEAIELLKGGRAEGFDVILLDLSLPDSSGLETVSRTRSVAPRTPMVVLSGQDDEETALRALKSGVEDYLVKGRGSGDTIARVIRYSIERQNAQEALRRSEELYRTVVEQAAENIFLVDIETKRILEANAALARSLGYTAEELKEMTLYDIVAHDRESIDQNIETIVQEGHRSLGERKYRRRDGSLADVEVNTRALSYDGKEAICIVAHDVTDRKRMEDNLRQSLGILLALYEASQILVSSLDFEEIGPRLLEIMRRVADLTAAAIALPDEHGELYVRYAVGPEETWRSARETHEVWKARREVVETKQPRPFWLDRTGSETLPPAGVCLPLRVRGRPIGVLEAYGSEALGERANVEVLTSFASQVGSALENARLYRELGEREHRLRDLVGQVLAAQEEERRRVAYEVHDGFAQTAAAAHQLLQAFALRYPPDSAKARKNLDRSVELVQQTVGEARQVIADLRPTALDDFGLATSIRQQVERLGGDGRRIEYEETLGDERLPNAVETALYRVAQESLTNVQKHAASSRVRVMLQRLEDSVCLRVRDWGQGFRPDEVMTGVGPGERVGLSSMRERIALLGGNFEIHSEPGAGTEVVAEVPLPEAGSITSIRGESYEG